MMKNVDNINHQFDETERELETDFKEQKKLTKKQEMVDLTKRREAIENRLRVA